MEYCLPCFGKSKSSDGERDPLLPKTALRDELPEQVAGSVSSARPTVDKVVDVLAALNAGKLPTQDQLSNFLKFMLNSELLKEDDKVLHGKSPLSKQSKKVVRDVNGLVQAFLQFGLEKNNDDKLQELFFEVKQIDVNHTAPAGSQEHSAESNGIDTPLKDQIASDSTTLLSSVRTLVEASLSSPIFRVAVCDLFSVAEDIAAHAAADVGHAAGQLQQMAENVEHQLRDNDIIGNDSDGNPKLDATINDIKGKGKEAADSLQNAGQTVKNDVQAFAVEAADITKEKVLARVQQVLARVQKDDAARGAMKAILILIQKYSQKIMEASETAVEGIVDNVATGKDALNEASQHGPESNNTYPPQPYASGTSNKATFDGPTDELLQGLKDMLQRIAKGHSLDGLIASVGRIIDSLKDAPAVVGQEINKNIEGKISPSTTGSDIASPNAALLVARAPGLAPQNSQPGKKAKKNKKARAREKRALEKHMSVITPSTSQEGISPAPSLTGVAIPPTENPLRVYFGRLGAFLDRALDKHERGWVASKEGAKMLEQLFDDGVNLINAVSEVAIEASDNIPDDKSASSPTLEEDGKSQKQAGEESSRKFKNDLTALLQEADSYIAAVQADKTTMQLAHWLQIFGEDLAVLVSRGTQSGSNTFVRNVTGMGGWTSWIGWAIPRVLRMLPSGAIPIPSIEVKSGKVEAALHALFVQSLARGHQDAVETSLVPDSVVFKEWTEVKIDMVDDAELADGASLSEPEVQTTSRVRIHMDGVRAKVDNMGYYFKYNGDIVGYEDEGLLDIDVGMHHAHEGLSADIELQLETEPLSPSNAADDDEPANRDIQQTITGASSGETRAAAIQRSVEPLFKVVDVQVAIPGLQFRINKSRHWFLNKVCLQRLAGPIVARVARQAIEEKMRAALDVMSLGFGAVIESAKQRGDERRKSAERNAAAGEESDAEEGLVEILSDWWGALLEMGPTVLGRSATATYNEHGQQVTVEARTSHDVTASRRGLVVASQTTTVEQPAGTPAMVYHPTTRTFETVDLPVSAIGGQSTEEVGEETIIAVGDGAQLFPGKGGAYGATEQSERGFVEQVVENVEGAVQGAENTLKDGVNAVEDVQDRFKERVDVEERTKSKTWKSKAFDF